MNIKQLIFCLLLVACAYSSCKKEDSGLIANRAVVIAYLMPGKLVSVKVYNQKAFDDTASYGALISGLALQLSDGTQAVDLQETATGTYTYSDAAFIQTGKTYTLNFTYNNEAVTATTTVPGKPEGYISSNTQIMIPDYEDNPEYADSIAISFRWNNPDSLYHVLVFKNDSSLPFRAAGSRNNAPINYTINTKQTTGYELYFRGINYLGTYRVILYRVNKEYSDVLTSNANTSSQQLDNPPGNITNGYGIFTGVQADTIKIQINQN